LIVVVAASAAPLLRGAAATNPAVMSLVKLSRVRVEVDPVPPVLADANINAELLTTLITQTLRDAGFFVVTQADEPTEGQAAPAQDDDDDLPTVHLSLITATDDKFPDAVSFCGILSLRQPADLRRIEQQMAAITFTAATIGLVDKNDLRESVQQGTKGVVRHFAIMQSKAGAAL
jgi:hypothetical protein